MAINCNKCEHSNHDDARFCSQCGEELPSGTPEKENKFVAINEKDLDGQAYVDEFKKSIQAHAQMARQQELDKFQNQAISWAKYQFAGVITAISILAAFLGFVGFKGINLQETIDSAHVRLKESADGAQDKIDLLKAQLEKSVDDAEKTINAGTSTITESQKKADALNERIDDELAKLETERATTEKSESQLVERIEKLRVLEEQLADKITQVSKLERSRYNIQVHYDIAEIDSSYRKSIKEIQAALLDKGYIMNSGDVMNVSTDKQEIIYFTDSAEISKNVKEIQTALTQRFGKISINPHDRDASDIKDPYKIIVKLCKEVAKNSFECKR